MTTLMMLGRTPCVVCGYRMESMNVGSYRVNKQTLIATGGALMASGYPCRECGNKGPSTPTKWTLDGPSLEAVNAVRARRGWDLWSA